MSMLVRKGTMLHRNPSRRSTGRRSSRGSVSRNKGENGNGAEASSRDKEAGTSGRNGAETANSLKSPDIRRGSRAAGSRNEINTCGTNLSSKTGDGNSVSPENDSRRTSSCTSQISGDERRQLYRYSKFAYESREYGSILSQIREADIESGTGWTFTKKFFCILWKSALATVLLVILTILPISMAFIGTKYLHDCPIQPTLPIYFLIGGFSGIIALIWVTYTQWTKWVKAVWFIIGASMWIEECFVTYEEVQSRQYERCEASFFEEDVLLGSNSLRIMQWALCLFWIVWFGFGHSWIRGLMGPDGKPPQFVSTLESPNGWCSKELYMFSYAHLYIVYGIAGTAALMWIACLIVATIRSYTHGAK